MALPAQIRVGGYRIIRKLAVGGMAEIFLAQLEASHGFTKQVVIKRMLPHLCEDTKFVDMFLYEARLAAHLDHPNVAQVFDIGESEGRVHYVMEYVHGPDLRAVGKRMHAEGGPRLELVLGACIGVAAGLHYAHTACDEARRPLAIVHRDVTPSNAVVTYGGVTKLLDFGVAKAELEGRESTAVGVLKGKLPYMSPEQIDTSVDLDGRSDVFSLGVMLWELTTLHRLYRCDSQMETIRRITAQDAPLPSSVCPGYPAGLERIVMRALARDRDLRYPSAFELQRALEQFAVEERLVVSNSRMAELMAELFADELEREQALLADVPREATDSEVFTHRARRDTDDEAAANTRVYEPKSASDPTVLDMPPSAPAMAFEEPEESRPQRQIWLAGGLAGAGLLLVGLTIGIALSSKPEAPDHDERDPTAAAAQDPTPVESTPQITPEPEPSAPLVAPEAQPEPEAPTQTSTKTQAGKETKKRARKKAKKPSSEPAKSKSDWNKNSIALPD